jgi:DNA-binding beta-propeller fold protein YncE
MRVEYTASNGLAEALERLGRTEDIAFCPHGRRLAIAGHFSETILLIDVRVETAASAPIVVLEDFVEIRSPCLRHPHGVAFLDLDAIIVANRTGQVTILKVPPGGTGLHSFTVPAVATIQGALFQRLASPGSVSVRRLGNEQYEVHVCNNYIDRVTRHVVDGRNGYRVKRNKVLLANGIDVPDGVALSEDGRWIAISNHGSHDVAVYENTPGLGRHTGPAGTLHGTNFPHGVRYTADGRFILVADAASPCLDLYASRDGDWSGVRQPAASVRVMDDETFRRGQLSPSEGGVKGIAIDGAMTVVATTCAEQPLAFFALDAVLSAARDEALVHAAQ